MCVVHERRCEKTKPRCFSDGDATFDVLTEMIVNKCVELGTESIPGCVLQIYVYLRNSELAGRGALISIVISALTTGYASAIISFDKDVDVRGRKAQQNFYGYIPDDNALRGRCFMLMTVISCLHNISKSLGCALLAASSSPIWVVCFLGGEMIIYLIFKIVRRDFLYWVNVEGSLGVLISCINRIFGKIVADFSGCLQCRHPYELGGAAFSASMVWAQILPFVVLEMHSYSVSMDSGDISNVNKNEIQLFLFCILGAWLLANIAFFCTIDISFMHTFFGTHTGEQFT